MQRKDFLEHRDILPYLDQPIIKMQGRETTPREGLQKLKPSTTFVGSVEALNAVLWKRFDKTDSAGAKNSMILIDGPSAAGKSTSVAAVQKLIGMRGRRTLVQFGLLDAESGTFHQSGALEMDAMIGTERGSVQREKLTDSVQDFYPNFMDTSALSDVLAAVQVMQPGDTKTFEGAYLRNGAMSGQRRGILSVHMPANNVRGVNRSTEKEGVQYFGKNDEYLHAVVLEGTTGGFSVRRMERKLAKNGVPAPDITQISIAVPFHITVLGGALRDSKNGTKPGSDFKKLLLDGRIREYVFQYSALFRSLLEADIVYFPASNIELFRSKIFSELTSKPHLMADTRAAIAEFRASPNVSGVRLAFAEVMLQQIEKMLDDIEDDVVDFVMNCF